MRGSAAATGATGLVEDHQTHAAGAVGQAREVHAARPLAGTSARDFRRPSVRRDTEAGFRDAASAEIEDFDTRSGRGRTLTYQAQRCSGSQWIRPDPPGEYRRGRR